MAYVCPSCKGRVTYDEGKPCIYCDKVSKTTFGRHGLKINRKTSPKYGSPWTEEEKYELLNLESLGYSLMHMSISLDRPPGSVKNKLRILKLTSFFNQTSKIISQDVSFSLEFYNLEQIYL